MMNHIIEAAWSTWGQFHLMSQCVSLLINHCYNVEGIAQGSKHQVIFICNLLLLCNIFFQTLHYICAHVGKLF